MISLKNIFAIVFLIVFFGVPLWMVGNAHKAALQKVIDQAATIGDRHPENVTVASHTCHHLLPNMLHEVMNPVMCWSCGDSADKLREDFMIFNPSESCKGRGQVTLLFTRQ